MSELEKRDNEKIQRRIDEIIDSSMADDDQKGDQVFAAVCALEKSGYKEVTLDFTGIELVNTAFLNNAIGSLFDIEKFDMVRCRVLVKGMDDTMMDLLRETIRVARKKFMRW